MTINQRQINDPIFADILDRIRIGKPTTADIENINSRKINYPIELQEINKIEVAVQFFLEKEKIFEKLVALFPLIKSVDSFNQQITKFKNIDLIKIVAIDKERNCKKKQVNNKPKNIKASQTAGLEAYLEIGLGSKIMLRRNLDPDRGLANGAVGLVIGFEFEENDETLVTFIIIQFENLKSPYKLARFDAEYQIKPNQYVNRSQFPVSLAWALTIHKVQGLSLDAIMVDIGKNIFEEGMAYVALSRARQLDNVFVIDFDKNKLNCCKASIREYNRLRLKNGGRFLYSH